MLFLLLSAAFVALLLLLLSLLHLVCLAPKCDFWGVRKFFSGIQIASGLRRDASIQIIRTSVTEEGRMRRRRMKIEKALRAAKVVAGQWHRRRFCAGAEFRQGCDTTDFMSAFSFVVGVCFWGNKSLFGDANNFLSKIQKIVLDFFGNHRGSNQLQNGY